MINRRQTLAAAAAATLGASSSVFSQASKWPNKPIRVIVPFAPAGGVDLLSRFLADKLGASLGQTLLIDNRPGAGGNIGTEMVVRAGNDGYTLLIAGSPTHVINPYLYKNLSYNPVKDLSPGRAGRLRAQPAGGQPRPGPQLRRRPRQAGAQQTRAGQLLVGRQRHQRPPGRRTAAQPGKGRTDARALQGPGRCHQRGDSRRGGISRSSPIPGTLALVKDGRIKAIAVTSAARSTLVPDLPTVTQAGYRDFEVLAWYCMSAPAGTPAPIVNRLASEIEKIVQEPATKDKFTQLGMEPNFKKGQDFIGYMARESAKWGKLIKDANIVAS
jgi:tripartite-type tricarboxylate transporter receptor subunit TctC